MMLAEEVPERGNIWEATGWRWYGRVIIRCVAGDTTKSTDAEPCFSRGNQDHECEILR